MTLSLADLHKRAPEIVHLKPQVDPATLVHKTMLEALQKGDEVVSAGGIVGKISKLTDSYATVEVAPGVEMTIQRTAISLLLPKGTIKSL